MDSACFYSVEQLFQLPFALSILAFSDEQTTNPVSYRTHILFPTKHRLEGVVGPQRADNMVHIHWMSVV